MENNKKIYLIKQKITGLSKSQLFLHPEVDPKFKSKIDLAIKKLKNGEPIEYIINNAEFYSLNFYVDNNVLIPRNDTEIMVDKAIEEVISLESNISLIDVGTGSSCIPISILKNTQKINNCYVIDISKNILEISRRNIELHGLKDKIEIIEGNLINPLLTSTYQGRNNYKFYKNIVITANLPYIKNNDFENIDKETVEFEPGLALYGGKETGFELYEKLIKQCIELKNIYKTKSTTLFIEIGFYQKEYTIKYLANLNLRFKTFTDNGGIDRCIKIDF